MKKRIAILLTLVMMLSMSLTACANTPTTNDVVDDSLLILLQINNPNMYANGVESAKAYQVPAGSAVVLWDENDPIFYIKKRDASGQETPMKRFRYVEEADEYGSSEAYVTKEDLNVFKDEIILSPDISDLRGVTIIIKKLLYLGAFY